MGLKENKLYFEKQFFDNWTDTPVHYAGQEFDAKGIDKWINPIYRPLSGRVSGMSSVQERAMWDVVCWAKNDVDAMGLADDIIDFVTGNTDLTLFKLNGYEINDHEWVEGGMVYVYLSFNVVSYIGNCNIQTPQPPVAEVWIDENSDTWLDENNEEWRAS